MPGDEGLLFNLSKQGQHGTWAHGRAFAMGRYRALAEIRRGVNLSGHIEMEGLLTGTARKVAAATLGIGGRIAAGISLQAAFPLDLFQEAGLIARVQAQLEAAAWIAAELALNRAELMQLLASRASGPWASIADLFLDELTISAGIWGKISCSAQLYAEASFVGHLLQRDEAPPGFTMTFAVDAGVEVGAGFMYLVNFGFKKLDPASYFNRVADVLVDMLDGEVPHLPPTQQAAARRSLPFLRLILPFSIRLMMNIGIELALQPEAKREEAVKIAVHKVFVQETRELILQALIQIALKRATDLSAEGLNYQASASLNLLEQANEALRELDAILIDHYSNRPPALAPMLLEALVRFAELDVLSLSTAKQLRILCTVTWSALALFESLTLWATQSEHEGSGWEQSASVSGPTSDTLKGLISTEFGQADSLSVGALTEYLLRHAADMLLDAEVSESEWGHALEWVAHIFTGQGQLSGLVALVFDEAIHSDPTRAAEMRARLLGTIASVVEEQIIEPLCNTTSRLSDIHADVIRNITIPTLRSIVRMLPAVEIVGTDTNRARILREQVSIVALQLFARVILMITDGLLENGLRDAELFIRDLSHRIDSPPLAKVRSEFAIFPMRLGSAEMTEALRLAAEIIRLWNTTHRKKTFDLVQNVVCLGLSTGNRTFDEVWQSLEGSNALEEAPIVRLVQTMTDSACQVFQTVIDQATQLPLKLAQQFIEMALKEAEELIRVGLEGIQQAYDVLVKSGQEIANELSALFETLRQLSDDIVAIMERLLNRVKLLMRDVKQWIHDACWDIVNGVVEQNSLFKLLPHFHKDAIRSQMSDLFEAWFQLAVPMFLAEGPLRLGEKMVSWARRELLDFGTITLEHLLWNLRQQAIMGMPDFGFPLKVAIPAGPSLHFGQIRFSGYGLASGVADLILNAPTVKTELAESVAKAHQRAMLASKEVTLRNEQAKSDAERRSSAERLTELRAIRPITISIYPKDEVNTEPVRLSIAIRGIRDTFLEFQGDVPPRVRVFVNGNEVEYRRDQWIVAVRTHSFTYLATLRIPSVPVLGTVDPVSEDKEATASSEHPRVIRTTSSLGMPVNGQDMPQPYVFRNRRINRRRAADAMSSPLSNPAGLSKAEAIEAMAQQNVIEVNPGRCIVQVIAIEGLQGYGRQGQVVQETHSFYIQRR